MKYLRSDVIPVKKLFDDFYIVPDFQREYVWQAEHVEKLLVDIQNEIPQPSGNPSHEYFIGSLVVCPPAMDSPQLTLIDGQQRVTTLYVTFCAFRDFFKTADHQVPDEIHGWLRATSHDEYGKPFQQLRLQLQYEDAGQVLWDLLERKSIIVEDTTPRSTQNIVAAYRFAFDFLSSEFANDYAGLMRFYGHFINKVKLIRIFPADLGDALKIFETINDRGVGLDAMDLLKNLLFMQVVDGLDVLKDRWRALRRTLDPLKDRPIRFLRYYALSRYDVANVNELRQDRVYQWFDENRQTAGLDSERNALNFSSDLLETASAYRNIREGKNEAGQERPALQNLCILCRAATTQHLPLLLAGRQFSDDRFSSLVAEMENLLFCYLVTRVSANAYEHKFATWASELRKVQTQGDWDRFVTDHFMKEKNAWASRFVDELRQFKLGDLRRYRSRYLLAKLTQHIEMAAYGPSAWSRSLGNFCSAEFDIEHIYPLDGGRDVERESGTLSEESVKNQLGNLMLLEKSINRKIKNRPFSEKQAGYATSKLLLPRILAGTAKPGTDRVGRMVSAVPSFSSWNESDIGRQHQWLAGLAREVWNVPTPRAESAGAPATV